MFDIGFWEMAIIAALALVMLGPERLPRLARKFGTFVGHARSVVRNLQVQIEEEVRIQQRGLKPERDDEPSSADKRHQ